jgi:hypothetical protein
VKGSGRFRHFPTSGRGTDSLLRRLTRVRANRRYVADDDRLKRLGPEARNCHSASAATRGDEGGEPPRPPRVISSQRSRNQQRKVAGSYNGGDIASLLDLRLRSGESADSQACIWCRHSGSLLNVGRDRGCSPIIGRAKSQPVGEVSEHHFTRSSSIHVSSVIDVEDIYGLVCLVDPVTDAVFAAPRPPMTLK